MNLLALDTATDACSVALLANGHIYQQVEIAPRRHADLILGFLDAVLAEAGLVTSQLDAIAVGIGPGSFMGVRTAVAVAQGLAFAADLPVIPVSTLQTLAQTAYQTSSAAQVLAGWDGRMQAIYWGAYQLQAGIMQPVIPDQLTVPAEIQPPILAGNLAWVCAGNAWSIYRDALPVTVSSLTEQLTTLYPSAAAMIHIAAKRYADQDNLLAAEALQPLYLRNQVAQLPLAAREGG